MDHTASPESCRFHHDPPSMYLSIFIVVGLLASYLPQHYRIISTRSSHGINSWFLLLGATSGASSLVNVVTLQWGVVRCCRFLSPGRCAESMLGIIQVFLQWACFNLVLILSLIYFPSDQKYVRVVPVESTTRDASPLARVTHYSSHFLSRFLLQKKPKTSNSSTPIYKHSSSYSSNRADLRRRTSSFSSVASDISSSDSSSFDPSNVLPPSATRYTPLTLSKEYTISLILAIVVLLHFLSSLLITLCLLLLLPKATEGEPSGTPPSHSGEHPTIRLLRIWATGAGVTSLVLACFQYLPQIWWTWRLGLVGSLSILMMVIQTPGSFVFVYSLALRPGVNWTTWIVYLVTGTLQAILLILCIMWKVKQRSLNIDDWGRPLPPPLPTSTSSSPSISRENTNEEITFRPHPERRPLISNHKPRLLSSTSHNHQVVGSSSSHNNRKNTPYRNQSQSTLGDRPSSSVNNESVRSSNRLGVGSIGGGSSSAGTLRAPASSGKR